MDLASEFLSQKPRLEPVDSNKPEGVHAIELSLKERIELEDVAATEGAASHPALLIAFAIRDSKGARVFTNDHAHEIDLLPTTKIEPLLDKAREINRLGKYQDAEAQK